MQVVELFESISGEGPNAGAPSIFLRLAGCNLRCAYCDTTYAQETIEHKQSLLSILNQITIKANKDKDLIITGGEPLLQAEKVFCLLQEETLHKAIRHTYIETNGTMPLDWISKLKWGKRISFVVDWKLPSAKAKKEFNYNILHYLRPQDSIKFVGDYANIEDRVALGNALSHIIDTVKDGKKFKLFFSPIYGTDLVKLTEFIQSNRFVTILMQRQFNCKIQLQLHKYIWDSNARGV